MRLVPLLAVIVTAAALYVTRAVLDQLVGSDGAVRVALLPPWQSMASFLAVGALGLLWLDRRASPGATATAVRPALGPLLLPLFALLLLVVPYLPVIPDVVPALQVLAGPARAIVWVVVLGQLLWVLWQVRLIRADWLQHASLGQLAIAAGIATAVVTGAAAYHLTDTALYPGGDEPHYLVMAQSLWRDGDLKIENNHARGDYREYFPSDLKPDYLTRGVDGEIYSIHPIGMPVLIAPVYAIGGYPAVLLAFVVMASIAAAMAWHLVVQLTNDVGAATFAWVAVALTSPFLLNAFAVYPEIPAALAVAVAFALITHALSAGRAQWLLVGVMCALLPWLSTKYAPMSVAIMAVALARILFDPAAATRSAAATRAAGPLSAAALVIPYGVSLLAWFYYFYVTWGTPMPQAPYGTLNQTDVSNVIFGAPGLLFDQEYGLLPYAPVYLLAGTGLWAMWRGDRESRRTAIEIIVIVAALLVTVGAFRIWWGGSAAPSRPLTSVLCLLALPIAVAFRLAPVGSPRRAVHALLLSASLALAVLMVFAEGGFLSANGRDGTSTLLEYLSPRWALWSAAPSFIYHEPLTAIAHTVVWLAIVTVMALVIRRVRAAHPGRVSLSVLMITAGGMLFTLLVMPHLPLEPRWPDANVRARGRVPLLEAFDARVRPIAVEYSPFRAEAAVEVVPRSSFVLEPGTRSDPQLIRVMHNGRFSLPAGSYRLEVDWSGARGGEKLGLQIGRTGNAWQSWPVSPQPGETWSTEFTVPLDAAFVGLRGTPELERIVKSARIVPMVIVDATHRPRTTEVIAASRSGGESVFYYDGNVFQEEQGFWVRGARRTRVTIYHTNAAAPLVLRVHSGPIANRLHILTPGFERDVQLEPLRPQTIEVPTVGRSLITLALTAANAFVPKELDAASSDPRPLGIWIEVVP